MSSALTFGWVAQRILPDMCRSVIVECVGQFNHVLHLLASKAILGYWYEQVMPLFKPNTMALQCRGDMRLSSQCAVCGKAGNLRCCTILCLSKVKLSHACPGCSGTLQCVTGAGIGTTGMLLPLKSAAEGL